MNRLAIARPLLNRPVQAIARPVLARSYISHRPSWSDNTPVAPHEWGTKVARWFTRLPEMGWVMVLFVGFFAVLYQTHWVGQYEPEYTYLVSDHYLDNPMTCGHRFTGNLSHEKVENELYANKNVYHHVYRPEQGVTAGAPWTDPRADLFIKRHFSIGNQKMTLENKVDRYMQHSTGDWVRLSIGAFDYGTRGWVSPLTGERIKSSSLGLKTPFDGARPNSENVWMTSIIA